ncbi:hypothetical protein LC608_10460 [Nostoc sp. XA010]|uniref:hypothetical protein n=1 Tax=Nostoc sp. XA010 TaxID=2780407 RepID=UPI001E53D28E|nr:hypothetical protein [Nostoc sp. XA010]MCC5657400.1 hypothetical protein [Nostoc sp. XA010]
MGDRFAGYSSQAMYRAKDLDKARYKLFNQEMYTNALVKLQLENDLQRAIERHEFQLYYQPIVSLTNGRLSGNYHTGTQIRYGCDSRRGGDKRAASISEKVEL